MFALPGAAWKANIGRAEPRAPLGARLSPRVRARPAPVPGPGVPLRPEPARSPPGPSAAAGTESLRNKEHFVCSELGAHAPPCVIYYLQPARGCVILGVVRGGWSGMCSSGMVGKFRKYPSDVASGLVGKKKFIDILQAS